MLIFFPLFLNAIFLSCIIFVQLCHILLSPFKYKCMVVNNYVILFSMLILKLLVILAILNFWFIMHLNLSFRFVFDAYLQQRTSLVHMLLHEGYDHLIRISDSTGRDLASVLQQQRTHGSMSLLREVSDFIVSVLLKIKAKLCYWTGFIQNVLKVPVLMICLFIIHKTTNFKAITFMLMKKSSFNITWEKTLNLHL